MSEPAPAVDFFERIHRWLERFEAGLLTLLLIGLIVLGLAQIILRNLVGISLPWADGAMRAMVLWLAMIAATVGAAKLKHIRIDIARRWIPARLLGIVHRLLMASTAAVCLTVAWFSLRLVALEYEFQAMAFASVPSWVVLLIVPIGFVLMGSRFLAHAVVIDPGASAGASPEVRDKESQS